MTEFLANHNGKLVFCERNAKDKNVKKYTSYETAIKYIENMIGCNDVATIDRSFERPQASHEEEKEYFSFFITDCSEREAKWLQKIFGLEFGYSHLLDRYILCVPYWGAPWEDIKIEPDVEWAEGHQEQCF